MDIDFNVIEEIVLEERFAVSTSLSDDRTIVLQFAIKDITGTDPVLSAIRQVTLFAMSPTEIIAARGILVAKMHNIVQTIRAIQDEAAKLIAVLYGKHQDPMVIGDYICVLDALFAILPLSRKYKQKTGNLLKQITDYANSL